MAQLRLEWLRGKYEIRHTAKARVPTILNTDAPPGADGEEVWIASISGPRVEPYAIDVERPVHQFLADCEPSEAGALKFANAWGLLGTRLRRERLDKFLLARQAVMELRALKKRDNWAGLADWRQKYRDMDSMHWVVGHDDEGRPQLEFEPDNLATFIVAQLICEWTKGMEYKHCARPGCPEWFYVGPGMRHRKKEGPQYHSPTCQNAHAYAKRKQQEKRK